MAPRGAGSGAWDIGIEVTPAQPLRAWSPARRAGPRPVTPGTSGTCPTKPLGVHIAWNADFDYHNGKLSFKRGDLTVYHNALKAKLRGDLIQPGDANYDEVRKLYNAMIDKRPDAIARCVDVADVMACVNYARENGILLAIRGGGHNGPGLGSCDGGLVIDLSRMRGVRVNPAARTAQVAGGCGVGRRRSRHACVRDWRRRAASSPPPAWAA